MRKIVFTGQLQNIEFASRWRRELDPEGVARGKSLRKYLRKGQRLDADTLEKVNRRLMGSQIDAKALKKGLELEIDKRNNANSRSYNKKGTYTQNGLVAPKDRNYRRQSLSNEREIRMDNAETLASKKRVAAMEEQFKNQPKTKIDYDKPNVKFEPKPSTPSNHVMPTNKGGLGLRSKLSMRSKLSFAGAGLLTAGAIGYGLYRKKRSDKGKKRGNYRK